MHQYRIRTALPKDYEDHVRIYRQLSTVDYNLITHDVYASYLSRLPDYMTIYVVVNEEDKVCGTLTLLVEEKLIHNLGKVGHIEDVVVDETYRGYGLGKVLVDHATKEARDKGCYKAILDCSDHNTGFYEKVGYIRKGHQMAIYF